MTRLLYMDDSYLKTFKATVVESSGNKVILDQTAFYPRGGGLPSDTGYLLEGSKRFNVVNVYKEGEHVVHELEGEELAPSSGSLITGVINWERRYRLMRMHTGLHVLGALFYNKLGALVTGNQIGVDKSRVDLNLSEFKKELVTEVFEEANRILSEGRRVKIYYLPRDEALKIPGVVKLAGALPPKIERLRIVEIEGVDIQADGGPHVSNTKEVGRLVLLKTESKGKRNKRIYFTLEEP